MTKKDSGWWDDFFPTFRMFFDKMPLSATNADVRFMVKHLNLKRGRRFLDCPCGIGRISVPLAKMGVKVTGVDITTSYLDELADQIKRLKLNMQLVKKDMRRITYDREFDAVANLWTSFGYFEKESDNLLVLKKLFAALKPGGKCLIQLVNRDWIMADFTPRGWNRVNDCIVFEERAFDYRHSVNRTTWHFNQAGKLVSHKADLRMYSFHELAAMFEKVGFVNIEGFGSTKEEPIDRTKFMMYVLGTRPRKG